MLDARLSQQIVSAISQRIVCREIAEDGALPPLRQLAEVFGVSVTTVREALSGLQTLGIITMKHGVGAFVVSPDTVVDDMYRTRCDIERLLAARAAAVIDDEEIACMLLHVTAMQRGAERQDVETYQLHDGPFHGVIFQAARSPILTNVVTYLKYGLFSPGSYMFDEVANDPDYLVISNKDHWTLFNAIRDHDVALAEEAVASHLNRAYTTWSRNLDSMCSKAKSELAQMEHNLT